MSSERTSTIHIGIIGFGAKGLYALERLMAYIVAEHLHIPITVHLFNRGEQFGSGLAYDTGQPDYLLMNFPNGYINMWPEAGAPPPVPHPMSFTQWLSHKATGQPQDKIAHQYAARAQVGAYLQDGLTSLVDNLPENVHLRFQTAEVVGVNSTPGGLQLTVKQSGQVKRYPFMCQRLMLTTGHPLPARPEQPAVLRSIYPVEEKLTGITNQDSIAIKGLGLTFIDAVLALTEGRGGIFTSANNRRLHYEPSGGEPLKIFPFSRSGRMMIPRVSDYGSPKYPLKYFRKEVFAEQRQYDFEKEILPILLLEMKTAYYDCLCQQYDFPLKFDHSLPEQLSGFHKSWPKAPVFTPEELFSALPAPEPQLHRYTLQTLDLTIREAALGRQKSPLAAAVATWRAISPVFNEIYSFEGLTPVGQQLFDERYAGHLNRLAYGPPLINMQKIAALARKGIIDFSFVRSPQQKWERDGKLLRLYTADASLNAEVRYLIDARIPKYSLLERPFPLYQSLITQGLAQPFLQDSEEGSYCPGSIALAPSGNLLDAQGKENPRIAAYGTPTEGTVFDNDTLSRYRNDFASLWARTTVEFLKKRKLTS